MTPVQYVDSSALVKRYVVEPDRDDAMRLLDVDRVWATGAHTEVEVRRTLTIRLGGDEALLRLARRAFGEDWRRVAIVQLDTQTCRLAAELAELTRARSLDALHLAAAGRVGAPAVRMVTFDVRQAGAARQLGWPVVGA